MKYYEELEKAGRDLEDGIEKAAGEIARIYGSAKKDYTKGKVLDVEMDEIQEWMVQNNHVCVTAVRLAVDSVPPGSMDWKPRLEFLLQNTMAIMPLYRLSDVPIGKNIRAMLKKVSRKYKFRVSDLNKCEVGSDLAWAGIPFVIPKGRVCRLVELSAGEMEQVVSCIREDDASHHKHVPMDGKAATQGLTGRSIRIEEVVENGRFVKKLVILIPLFRTKVFVPLDGLLKVLKREGVKI